MSSERELDAIESAAASWIARRDVGLSATEERDLAAWLAADERHRSSFAFHETAWRALEQPVTQGASSAFKSHLKKLAQRRRRRRYVITGTFAVSLALLGLFARLGSNSRPEAKASLVAQLIGPTSQLLADGSSVELKDNARFSVEFSAALRRIILHEGEAHFTVKSDPSRPFAVIAAGVEVRAVGTAFSVNADSSAIEVVVTHGTVALNKDAKQALPSSEAPLATVAAGYLARVSKDFPSLPEIRALDAEEYSQRLAWRGPRLEFSRATIAEAVTLFNRHAAPDAPRLVVNDPEVAATRVSGVFRADNASTFVVLLERGFDVKAERRGNEIVLMRSP